MDQYIVEYKKLVIKVGTNVLTKADGSMNLELMKDLVEQIVQLKHDGFDVVLVSSGAVGAGKSIPGIKNKKVTSVRSAIGQVKLMNIYADLFQEHDMYCAQVLATKEDFTGIEYYKNMKVCFNGLLNDNIIPIVNENDVVALNEMMFTDNDQLAGLTAFMIEADALVILSNINGLLDRNPDDPEAKIIEEVQPNDDIEKFLNTKKSSGGRGGIQSKVETAQRCASKGIGVYIANGRKRNMVIDLFKGREVGTFFVPEILE